MQYSLGNMLKGGGALNPDGLSLDLALALDRSFTTDPADAGKAFITSRRGPAAKFSRGSGATQVNAAGLIEYAPENLILRSEEFNEISWAKLNNSSGAVPVVTPNAVLSPTGTLTADLVAFPAVPVGENPRLEQNRSSIAGSSFVFSFWIRSDSPTTVRVGHLTPSITVSATTDWVRVSYAFTFTSGGFPQIVGPINGAASNVYLWGAQLERASTARTYYPTTSAVFYGPRFDHDPATGDSKGLLIEESRINLLRESQALDNSTFWSGTGAAITVTPNNQISPDGLQNAETLTIASSLAGGLYQSVTCTANTVYTLSFYVKLGTFLASNFLIAVRDDVGGVFIAENVVPSVTPVTGEWRRITYTFTTPTNCTTVRPYVYRNNAPTASGTVFIWGAQLEAGAFPLSYIPTTSGTAARSADVCSIAGTDFSLFWNSSEVSIFSEASVVALSALNSPIFSVQNGTTNIFGVYHRQSQGNRLSVADAANQNTVAAGFNLANVRYKCAFGVSSGSSALYMGGSLVPSAFVYPYAAADNLKMSGAIISGNVNAHISRLSIYRKRLSNDKLQTLTAP